MAGMFGLSGQESPLRRVHDARRVPNLPAEARPRSVSIEGLMTLSDPAWNNWFFFDGEEGIYVTGLGIELKAKTGDRVRLSGVVLPGSFAPNLGVTNEVILGHGTLPEPRMSQVGDVLSGSEDSQWIELAGTLLGIWDFEGHTVLTLGWGYGEVVVTVARQSGKAPPELRLGSRISVRGVGASNYSKQHRLLGVRVHCPGFEFLRILNPRSGRSLCHSGHRVVGGSQILPDPFGTSPNSNPGNGDVGPWRRHRFPPVGN